jgi:Family of unknown function (DUF6502)
MFSQGRGRLELNLAIDDERTALLEAIEESLRPLMRAAFEYGVSYQDLIEVVRALYIFTQKERQESQGRPVNATSLGLMAGVTRSEVMKLVTDREERDRQRELISKRIDQIGLLLGRWHDDPQFSTPYGAPLDLSLQPEGSFRTFDQLIESSGTELDRETAMQILLANRCAEVHVGKFIRCTTRAFLPSGKDLSKISRLGRLGSALHSTFTHNLFKNPSEPSYFDRAMVSDFPLSKLGRDVMLGQVRADGEDFIDGMDRWVSNKAVGYKDEENGRRYGITALFFEEITKPAPANSVSDWGFHD